MVTDAGDQRVRRAPRRRIVHAEHPLVLRLQQIGPGRGQLEWLDLRGVANESARRGQAGRHVAAVGRDVGPTDRGEVHRGHDVLGQQSLAVELREGLSAVDPEYAPRRVAALNLDLPEQGPVELSFNVTLKPGFVALKALTVAES